MIDPELPMYATEVRFYREVLAISWEFGSHLRRLGALIPDAVLEGERFLYRLSPETIAQNKAAIARYRSEVSQTKPIYA